MCTASSHYVGLHLSFRTIDLSDPEGGLSLSSDSEFFEDEMRKNIPVGSLKFL